MAGKGFIICCPALKIMLCGFKICCPDFYLSVRATIDTVYIILSRLALLRGLHPSRLFWVSVLPNSYNARTPGDWDSLSHSFGLQPLRLFQAYPGPLGGKGALLEFPLSHKVTTLGRTNFSATRIKKKKLRDHLSLPFKRNKYLELLFYLLTYRLFWKDN